MFADIEDMYAASKLFDNKGLEVIKEVRTHEEPESEYRYRAVVVVRKDLPASSYADLKGLKSCHTGVGRNAGYKIPLSVLSGLGHLDSSDDATLSSRENELKKLSSFFSKSCIVGKWSPHADVDKRLKSAYFNLCEMCEDPGKCDYPDAHSGYDGALKCLVEGGGEVAFTKVIVTRKVFGLAYGKQAAGPSNYQVDDYAYLCPDGTKVPLTEEKPCFTAARPWAGYMTYADESRYEGVRGAIDQMYEVAKGDDQLLSSLGLNKDTFPSDNVHDHPHEYLEKAKYNAALEGVSSTKTIKIALADEESDQGDERDCEEFSMMAFSRGIRPKFECVNHAATYEGLTYSVGGEEEKADIAFVDPGVAIYGAEEYTTVPVVREWYAEHPNHLTILVKKGEDIKTLQDLKGKDVALHHDSGVRLNFMKLLLDKGVLTKSQCPYAENLEKIMKITIVDTRELEMKHEMVTKLSEEQKAELGGVKYHQAIVISHASLPSQRVVDEYTHLPLENEDTRKIPSRLVVMKKNETEMRKEEVVSALLALSDLFSQKKEIYSIFDNLDVPNVHDHISPRAGKLVKVEPDWEELNDLSKLNEELKVCHN